MTESDWAYLDSLRAKNAPAAPPAAPEMGTMEYVGKRLFNAPNNIAANLGDTVGAGLDWLTGKPAELRQADAEAREQERGNYLYETYDLPEAKGVVQNIANVGLSVGEELPGIMAPAAAIGRGARLLGAGRAAPVIGDIGAGALSGNRYGGGEAAMQAGEFGLQGAIGTLLPGRFSALRRATVEGVSGAGIALGGQALRGNDPFTTQGMTQAGVQAAFPFAMRGRRLFGRQGETPGSTEVNPEIPQDFSQNTAGLTSPESGLPIDWKLRSRRELPGGGYEHVFDTPEGPQRIGNEQRLGSDPFRVHGDEGIYTAPQTEGDAFANVRRAESSQPAGERGEITKTTEPKIEQPAITFREAVNNRSIVDYQGEQGKLSTEADGVYFRKMRSNESQRVFGLDPDSPVTAAEGLSVVREGKRRLLGKPVETPGPYNTQIVAGQPQGGPRLKRLRGGGSEGGSIDPRLMGSIAGATIGGLVDTENRGRGIALGAIGGGILSGVGRRLMRRVPSAETAASQTITGVRQPGATKTEKLFGGATRQAEKLFKKGRSSSLETAQEQSRGLVGTIASDMGSAFKAAAPKLSGLSAPQKDAVKMYLGSDRGAGATALLRRAALPPEVHAFVEMATQNKAKLQEIVADAQSDPSKAKLIRDTLGTWVTEPYRAYVDNANWQRPTTADVDALVAENRALPQYAGQTDDMIRKDIESWLSEVNEFGGDWSRTQTEGKSRMSQSLFMGRKNLRPSVKKALGYIEDPVEREVLSIAKLVKSAQTAKLVTEIGNLTDDAGRKLSMTRSQWDAEIQSAIAAGDTAKAEFLRSNYENVPDMPGLGKLAKQGGEGMMAQRQVLDALQAGPGHGTVDWSKGILGAIAKLNRLPKAAFTLYNPATHLHNVFQAPLQGIAAGLNPFTFVGQVRRMHADKKRMRMAKEDGMFDAHLGAGEFRRAADSFETILKPGKLGAVQDFHEAVKGVYGKPDQWVRAASYNSFLDEGLGALKMPEKQARAYATEMTNRYTQNYASVAPIVGIARNIPLVNPFISYTAEMARIIKNLAVDVVSDPLKAKYGVSRRLKSGVALLALAGMGTGLAKMAEGLSGVSPEDKQRLADLVPILPAYMRGKTLAGVGYDQKKDTGSLLSLNAWLPAEDFVTMAKNILSGDWEAFAANNPVGSARNPIISVASEMITGKDPITGKESRGYERFVQPIQQSITPPILPGGHTFGKLKQGFTRNNKGELGVTDDRGRRETPTSALLSAGGVSIAKMDRKRLLGAKDREKQRQVSEAQSQLRRLLRSDVNDDARKDAQADFKEERRRILGR